ncbi:phenylacetate--CoA ligase family protein [Pseudemcibacter aquimaris]|uniref:phenylacetate--CoA ligase family protein n=1 Tax=Pseudemcibacter aquimaris TaxID=2857064 RepID=UPI002010D628|nr:hypothetical protein [Pseudemcibacter aquimaris]MCC3860671.1 hypothetical protein [Pseudemcibacter aquimaris]WDU59491.1 hypothetical protein KW060_04360 [Pseudemcibacter aquimaris]
MSKYPDFLKNIKRRETLFWPVDNKNIHASFDIINEKIQQSQWYKNDIAEELLRRQLGKICGHAFKNTPFFRKRLENLRIDKKKGVDLKDFSNIPILKRADIQNHKDKMHSRDLAMENYGATDLSTTGSTSTPLAVRWSRCAYLVTTVLQDRWYKWAGLDGNRNLARLYSEADEINGNQGSFSKGWMSGNPNGGYAVNSSTLPISIQAKWLEHIKPDYLMAYPSNVYAIFDYAENNNIDLSSIEKILTYGEVLSCETKSYFLNEHAIDVIDKYSCRETGCMALKCKSSDNYHVQTSNVYLEILREDGSAAEEGEVGKVVVTSLTNTAMPLIRYEVGDYAAVGSKCVCGRGLPTIKKIMGRTRNMAKLRDGDSFWPRFYTEELISKTPVKQIQYIQVDYEKIHVLYVSDGEISCNDRIDVCNSAKKLFPFPIEVTIEKVDFVGREWGGKFEDFLCEI